MAIGKPFDASTWTIFIKMSEIDGCSTEAIVGSDYRTFWIEKYQSWKYGSKICFPSNYLLCSVTTITLLKLGYDSDICINWPESA